jgi:hypothetical protein
MFLLPPTIAKLSSPKNTAAVEVHLACRAGCNNGFQEGVVLGCADIAELPTHGVAEVPKIPLRFELSHGKPLDKPVSHNGNKPIRARHAILSEPAIGNGGTIRHSISINISYGGSLAISG